MAKKQKSFADKASGRSAESDAVMVKYVKSVKSEKTGYWRFNEQMVKLEGGENLDAALKRMDDAVNLVDIDLSKFESNQQKSESKEDKSQDVTKTDIENSVDEAVAAEDQPVSDILDQFVKRRQQIFIVSDEFGTTTGLINLEDAIETLLGVEIVDEHDNVVDMRKLATAKLEKRQQRVRAK